MMNGDKGHYSKKHPDSRKPVPATADAVQKEAKNGEVPCAVAFRIAGELSVDPGDVGSTMDLLELRIAKCQMGLFGYMPEKSIVRPAEKVERKLEAAIRRSLADGRLPCMAAWKIAKSFKVSKMAVASACEALKIKISDCQLGAF
jgi:hypothetical protein